MTNNIKCFAKVILSIVDILFPNLLIIFIFLIENKTFVVI